VKVCKNKKATLEESGAIKTVEDKTDFDKMTNEELLNDPEYEVEEI